MSVNQLYPRWLVARENNKPCTIIDVRSPAEYARGHVPGAKLIALNTVPARADEFPADADIYLICHSGMRSAQAAAWLAEHHGHQRLINVEGGTLAWAEAGYPLEN